ncbi:MAG: TolB family protein [Anaerolineae bacterium]
MKHAPVYLIAAAGLILTACTSAQPIRAADAATPTRTPRPTIAPTATATSSPIPTGTPASTPPATPLPTIAPTATATPPPRIRRLTVGDCCTGPFWSPDSTEVRFIDRNPNGGPAGVWGIDITQPNPEPYFITAKLGVTSPDGRLLAYPERQTGLAVIERLDTGETWRVDLAQSPPSFTPDSSALFWTETDRDLPFEQRVATFWLSGLKGENRRPLITLSRGSPLAWLGDDTLLVATFEDADTPTGAGDTILARLSLENGALTELLRTERPRGIALNRAGTGMVYYAILSQNSAGNGVWHVDLTQQPLTPRRLPFLGSYQWQTNNTLIYIPFEADASRHVFYGYNLNTGQTVQLTSVAQAELTVANNDWRVSPDGRKIVLLASRNRQLDGLWLVELN